jgi:predicted solute-binding protein
MKNAQTVNAITDQAAQLKAALTAAHDKAAAEAAAAAQKAQAHQQQLDALRADHTASADSNEVTLSSLCSDLHDSVACKSMSLQTY